MDKKPKSESRRRKKLCPVRLTEVEAKLLDTLASNAGLSRGAYIRRTALGHEGERSQKRAKPQQQDMARFIGQLGKLGGNMTQINNLVKEGNMHGLDAQIVDTLINEIRQIKEPISDMRAAWLKAMD